MPIPGVRETAAGWVAVVKYPPKETTPPPRRWWAFWEKPQPQPQPPAPMIERASFRSDNIVEHADRAVEAIGLIAHSDCFKRGILGERNAIGTILSHRLFDCLQTMLKVDQLTRDAKNVSDRAQAAGIADATAEAIEKSVETGVVAPVRQLERLASQVLILDMQAVSNTDFHIEQPTSFEDLEGRVFAATQLSGM